jgi:energy-coupling factor transporter ATP-binding protein EcfA2
MSREHHVNISGGNVQGFIQENNGTVNQYFVSQVSELISSSNSQPGKALIQIEYRQRKVLLSKVRNYWIQDVLEKSFPANAMINLDLERRSHAIDRPFEDLGEVPTELDENFSMGTDAAEVFVQIGEGRTLLILGEPGAGKTITLLKLAQNLLDRAEEDVGRFIPVVFNLSSWGNKASKIESWLVEELLSQYQVPKEVGKKWVDDQQLVLLLDGLDEVRPDRREACVEAINQFTQKYFLTEMVVCSRIVDYEILSNRLKLRGAICIRSLTPDQVDHYLDRFGEELKGVKDLLRQDAVLQELARSPLVLSIITLAYHGKEASDLPQTPSLDIHRQHLFNTYIDRMFQRKRVNQKYSKEKTIQWLSWLAKGLSNESQSIFLIDKMQPTWLQSKAENVLYRFGTILTGTLVVALILFLGMAFDLNNLSLNHGNVLTLNLLAWGLVLFGYFGIGKVEIKPFETLTWPWKKSREDLRLGLFNGLMWGLILCPFSILWCVQTCLEGATRANIVASVILGLILGLIRLYRDEYAAVAGKCQLIRQRNLNRWKFLNP